MTGKRGSGKGSKSTDHNTAILSYRSSCTQSCRRNRKCACCVDEAGAGKVGEEEEERLSCRDECEVTSRSYRDVEYPEIRRSQNMLI